MIRPSRVGKLRGNSGVSISISNASRICSYGVVDKTRGRPNIRGATLILRYDRVGDSVTSLEATSVRLHLGSCRKVGVPTSTIRIGGNRGNICTLITSIIR